MNGSYYCCAFVCGTMFLMPWCMTVSNITMGNIAWLNSLGALLLCKRPGLLPFRRSCLRRVANSALIMNRGRALDRPLRTRCVKERSVCEVNECTRYHRTRANHRNVPHQPTAFHVKRLPHKSRAVTSTSVFLARAETATPPPLRRSVPPSQHHAFGFAARGPAFSGLDVSVPDLCTR